MAALEVYALQGSQSSMFAFRFKVKCRISRNALIAGNLDKDVKLQAPTEFHLLVCILNCNVVLAL